MATKTVSDGPRPPLCVKCMKRPAPRRSNWAKIPPTAWRHMGEFHHPCGRCFSKRLKGRGRSRRGRRPAVGRPRSASRMGD